MEEFLKKLRNTPDTTYEYEQSDIEGNRVLALISYLSLLCLIPLFMKKSAYATYHAKQGLVLAIAEIVLLAFLSIFSGIPLIGLIFRLARFLVKLASVGLSVLGILNVLNGRAKELPFIGRTACKF